MRGQEDNITENRKNSKPKKTKPVAPAKDYNGRNTGVHVGYSGKATPTRQYSVAELYPNLKGAPTATVAGLVGAKPQTGYEGLVPANELDAITSGARGVPGAGGTGAGGAGGVGYSSMINALKKLAEMQQGQINTSSNQLAQLIQQQVNPYANMPIANTPTEPGLQQLLQSQGVDTSPLSQFASALSAQNQGQADAYRNLMNQMSGMYEQQRVGQQADIMANRNDMLNALQSNIFGTGAALMGKKNVDRNAITNMLLAAMKNRAG